MGLFYNNTNIPASSNVYLNNQSQKQVFYNNTLVWKKELYLLGSPGNNAVQNTMFVNWGYAYDANLEGKHDLATVSFNGWNTLYIDANPPYVNTPTSQVHVCGVVGFGTPSLNADTWTQKQWGTGGSGTEVRGTRKTYTFNISSLTGSYTIMSGLTTAGGGISGHLDVYNIWLS